jgi:hypothetical protein
MITNCLQIYSNIVLDKIISILKQCKCSVLEKLKWEYHQSLKILDFLSNSCRQTISITYMLATIMSINIQVVLSI